MATTARFASTGAAFTTPAPASSTTTAAATAAAASAATATATLIAALAPIVRRFLVLFTPLPVLQGIPIRIPLVRTRLRAGGLTRLAGRRLLMAAFPALGFLTAAFLTPVPFAAVFLPTVFLGTVWCFFGLVVVERVGSGLSDRFGIAWCAERSFQIEVGSKVVVRRRRRALFLWRTRRAALPARRLGSTALRASRLSTRLAALTLASLSLTARTGRAGRFCGWGCRLGLRGRRG